MSRDWRLYLEDMALCCRKIASFVGDSARDEFLAKVLVYDAVLRNLEIPGEAAKHVLADAKARMPEVAWRETAGMSGWLAHAYFTINADVFWNAIVAELPLPCRSLRAFSEEDQAERRGEIGADPPTPKTQGLEPPRDPRV